jgi:hypothetical protein
VTFIYTNGPLLWAVILWGNSLVFHDFDKISSVYIHLLPGGLFYTLRWFMPMGADCGPIVLSDFLWAIGGYLLWQQLYFLKTEVVDKAILDSNPGLLTSLRYLSTDAKNPTSIAVQKLCRTVGIFSVDEKFDHTTFKTKAIFMFTQLVYTVIAMFPTPILYRYRYGQLAFIIFVFVVAVYNGAS